MNGGTPTRPRELLRVDDLYKRYDNGVVAVDGVSLVVHEGQTLGIVGESGCGKSTTGKLILRLIEPDRGNVIFDGLDLTHLAQPSLRSVRAKLQFVPQNPQTSLNPRLSISSNITFNLRAHGTSRRDAKRRVIDLLDRVAIPASYASRFPHELSGGQLQRVAIARALSTDPKLIVCDEAVSALDKSVQAQILNLLADLQRDLGVAYLFISHDLGVVEHLSDRVVVMYLGRVVETAPAHELWAEPAHPYTRALFASTPGAERTVAPLAGELPSPVNPPSGCTFRTRCPLATEVCAEQRPDLVPLVHGHEAACLLVERAVDLTSTLGR
jgi:oligopeptide/dipeptide ABC transporter ATP-binding protein